MNHDHDRELRALLKGYCEHVPKAVNDGSINLALAFKDAVKAGNTLLKKPRATEAQLQAAINLLHTFWDGTAKPAGAEKTGAAV